MAIRRPDSRPRTAEAPARQVTHEEIATLAYDLYEQRGHREGRDQQDWFEAERVLRQRSLKPS